MKRETLKEIFKQYLAMVRQDRDTETKIISKERDEQYKELLNNLTEIISKEYKELLNNLKYPLTYKNKLHVGFLYNFADLTDVIYNKDFEGYRKEITYFVEGLFQGLKFIGETRIEVSDIGKRLIKLGLHFLKPQQVMKHIIEHLRLSPHTFTKEFLDYMYKLTKIDHPVLITGETGTGKEKTARLIHYLSDRRDKPFVAVNCGGIPSTLIESELFGYVKGAFTGAVSNKEGLFKTAGDGTIFLDEIGDMPLETQAKLLRVLQDNEFYPVGSTNTETCNARVISATNRNLSQMMADNKFRNDLFYRISTFRVHLPSLRETLSSLTDKQKRQLFTSQIAKVLPNFPTANAERISDKAFEKLCSYDYPGNYRELESIIMRAIVKTDTVEITENAIEFYNTNKVNPCAINVSTMSWAEVNKYCDSLLAQKIRHLAVKHKGRKIDAVKEMGLHPDIEYAATKLTKLCEKYGIDFKKTYLDTATG